MLRSSWLLLLEVARAALPRQNSSTPTPTSLGTWTFCTVYRSWRKYSKKRPKAEGSAEYLHLCRELRRESLTRAQDHKPQTTPQS